MAKWRSLTLEFVSQKAHKELPGTEFVLVSPNVIKTNRENLAEVEVKPLVQMGFRLLEN